MEFPKPEIKEEKLIDYKDNFGVDELLSDLSKPKQQFQRESQEGESQRPFEPGVVKPERVRQPPGIFDPLMEEKLAGPKDVESLKVRQEKAQRTGRRTAKMIDGAMTFTNGSLIARADDISQYKASEGEIDDLSEAWAEIAEEYDYNINPWLKLAVLNLSIYMPRTVKAFQDRRFNQIKREIDSVKNEIDQTRKELTDLKDEKTRVSKSEDD